VLDGLVHLESAVRKQAVKTNRRAETAEGCKKKGQAQDRQTRERKQDQADEREHVDQDQVKEDRTFARNGFPKGPFPGTKLFHGALAHVSSQRDKMFTHTPGVN
jgi:hypothetical protein